MKHRFASAVCAAAFPLCLAAAMLWVRSYWCFDEIGWPMGRHLVAVGSVRGRVLIAWGADFPASAKQGWNVGRARPHPLEHEFAGFGYRDRFITTRYHVHAIAFPIGLPTILLIAPATLFVRQRMKSRPGRRGFEVGSFQGPGEMTKDEIRMTSQ